MCSCASSFVPFQFCLCVGHVLCVLAQTANPRVTAVWIGSMTLWRQEAKLFDGAQSTRIAERDDNNCEIYHRPTRVAKTTGEAMTSTRTSDSFIFSFALSCGVTRAQMGALLVTICLSFWFRAQSQTMLWQISPNPRQSGAHKATLNAPLSRCQLACIQFYVYEKLSRGWIH